MKRLALLWFVIALILVSGLLFFREFRRVQREEVSAWKTDHSADCAVVLTGSHGRVREGFDLLAQRMIKKLIISGVHPQAGLRDIFPEWPFYGNLDLGDVVLERRSTTTYGNIQQSIPLIEALRCRNMIIITSHLHMYRARRTFQAELPALFPIYSRATVSGGITPDFFEILVESSKSLFYSTWAY